jgi:hypothetical protein
LFSQKSLDWSQVVTIALGVCFGTSATGLVVLIGVAIFAN